MLKGLKQVYEWVTGELRRWRFRQLTPSLPFQPVLLNHNEGSTRRGFLRCVMGFMLAFFASLVPSHLALAEWLRRRAGEFRNSSTPAPAEGLGLEGRIYMPIAHQNVPHTDAHNNSGGHADVSSEVGHANFDRPHSDSYFDSPHVDVKPPEPPPPEHVDGETPKPPVDVEPPKPPVDVEPPKPPVDVEPPPPPGEEPTSYWKFWFPR